GSWDRGTSARNTSRSSSRRKTRSSPPRASRPHSRAISRPWRGSDMADTVVSLDLGELTDFSARAILRRGLRTDARRLPARTERGHSLHRYDLLALKRYEKGTPYSDVVSDTVVILARPDLQPLLGLVVDATGVGRPVVETFRTELARLRRDRGLEVPC